MPGVLAVYPGIDADILGALETALRDYAPQLTAVQGACLQDALAVMELARQPDLVNLQKAYDGLCARRREELDPELSGLIPAMLYEWGRIDSPMLYDVRVEDAQLEDPDVDAVESLQFFQGHPYFKPEKFVKDFLLNPAHSKEVLQLMKHENSLVRTHFGALLHAVERSAYLLSAKDRKYLDRFEDSAKGQFATKIQKAYRGYKGREEAEEFEVENARQEERQTFVGQVRQGARDVYHAGRKMATRGMTQPTPSERAGRPVGTRARKDRHSRGE